MGVSPPGGTTVTRTNPKLYVIEVKLLMTINTGLSEMSLKNGPKTANQLILLTIGLENGLKHGCKTNLNGPRKASESE